VLPRISPPAPHASDYWSQANVARDRGRIAHALVLYRQAVATSANAEACFEAATYALEVSRNLVGIEFLYRAHRRAFGLAPEECRFSLMEELVGADGVQFGLDCLTRANLFENVPIEWHELLADVLVSHGQLHHALQWRRVVQRRYPERQANRVALANLCETLGRLEEAVREYRQILEQSPGDPDAVLGLTFLQEHLGVRIDDGLLRALFDACGSGSPRVDTDGAPASSSAARSLRLIFAAARRGLSRIPAEARQRLPAVVQSACDACRDDEAAYLAEGYRLWLDGEWTAARGKFVAASAALAARTSSIAHAAGRDPAVDEAVHWARVLLTEPRAKFAGEIRLMQDSRLPAFDGALLERKHAGEMWRWEETLLPAMSKYASALRAHHVTAVPMQYDLRGDYKVVWHEAFFYAIPRSIREFTIIEGRVYRIKGGARSSTRQLPPWIVSLARRFAWLRRSRLARGVARPVRRLGRALGAGRIVRPVARMCMRALWLRYTVRGVLMARTPHEIRTLIEQPPQAA